jgi:adenosylcobyric acid synthase
MPSWQTKKRGLSPFDTLAWAGVEASTPVDYPARREADLDRLADAVEATLDWERLAGVLPGG